MAIVGLMEVMTGTCETVKSRSDVTVAPPTVIEIGPVVAPGGTVTTKELLTAEMTVAVVPLN